MSANIFQELAFLTSITYWNSFQGFKQPVLKVVLHHEFPQCVRHRQHLPRQLNRDRGRGLAIFENNWISPFHFDSWRSEVLANNRQKYKLSKNPKFSII